MPDYHQLNLLSFSQKVPIPNLIGFPTIIYIITQNYINDKAYDAAHHTDLWKAMQEEADKQGLKDEDGDALDVKEILDTWILQMGAYIIKQLWGKTRGKNGAIDFCFGLTNEIGEV